MDNFTHTLTGLMISRAGLNRLHERATLALLLSANAPDLDGVCLLGGPLAYIRLHRGLTHSIAFAPVMALVTVLIVCAVARKFHGWLSLFAVSLVGVASHLLLDWTNTYGVRFFLPFSSEWLHLDLNPLMDLWIIAVLLMAWLMVYIVRMVNTEIGAKPGSGRGLAIFALVFFLGYDFSKYLLHQQAIAILNSRIYDGSVATRVAAFPVGSNPLAWRGLVETPTFFKQINVNVMGDFDPGAGATFYKPDNRAAIAAAKAAHVFQTFLSFDQYPRWTVTPVAEPEGGNRVELLDLRLPFKADAILDSQNRVLRASMSF